MTSPNDPSRVLQQLRLLLEADRLKTVERRTYVTDGSRHENAAEHSWHLALAVLLLGESFESEFDQLKALEMAILHDLVEIEAGDTFVYDEQGQKDRLEREQKAADALFGTLPADQSARLRAIWDEFEAGESVEAQLVRALDRLCPVLLNLSTGGRAWREHGIERERVEKLVLSDLEVLPSVQKLVAAMLEKAETQGFFAEKL